MLRFGCASAQPTCTRAHVHTCIPIGETAARFAYNRNQSTGLRCHGHPPACRPHRSWTAASATAACLLARRRRIPALGTSTGRYLRRRTRGAVGGRAGGVVRAGGVAVAPPAAGGSAD